MMGLFGKKKNDKGTNQLGTPQQFYTDCVVDFHKTAAEKGYATKGLINIPELLPIGQKTALAFLKDTFFQMQFGSNPQMYYYVIMSLSLQAGVAFATKWHENYSELKDGSYVQQIIDEGPADAAEAILKAEFGWSKEDGNAFYNEIFKRWLAMHEPYWQLQDPRDYTFSAMVAAYQLGVSMILVKYGY